MWPLIYANQPSPSATTTTTYSEWWRFVFAPSIARCRHRRELKREPAMRQARSDLNADSTASRKNRRPAFTVIAGLIALAIGAVMKARRPPQAIPQNRTSNVRRNRPTMMTRCTLTGAEFLLQRGAAGHKPALTNLTAAGSGGAQSDRITASA